MPEPISTLAVATAIAANKEACAEMVKAVLGGGKEIYNNTIGLAWRARAEANAEEIKKDTALAKAHDREIAAIYRGLELKAARDAANNYQVLDRVGGILLEHGYTTEDVGKNIHIINEDILHEAMDKTKNISDAELHTIFAQLLAGESVMPGTVSKRTLDVASKLSPEEATMCVSLFRCVIIAGGLESVFVTDANLPLYQSAGIEFGVMQLLVDAGIVIITGTGTSYIWEARPGGLMTVGYGSQNFTFKLIQAKIPRGRYEFTPAGLALYKVAAKMGSIEPIEGFMDYVRNHWVSKMEEVESPATPAPV